MKGRVTKSVGGEAVAGAKVVLDKTRSATTDEDGVFVFENTQTGRHKIRVTAGQCYKWLQFVLYSPPTSSLGGGVDSEIGSTTRDLAE